MRSRLGDDSRIVLSAVLELSRRSETKVKTESTGEPGLRVHIVYPLKLLFLISVWSIFTNGAFGLVFF